MIWDPCLARAVASELEARLGGERAVAVDFLRERRAVRVHFREATLAAELAPERGVVVLRPASEPALEAERLPAVLATVAAVPDERIVVLSFRRVRGRKANPSLILDLAANRRNAYWAEGADLVVRKRLRGSAVVVGRPWTPPVSGRRAGADGTLEIEKWLAEYPIGRSGTGSPGADPERLDSNAVKQWRSRIAYVSAINASWLLSAGSQEAAFRQWRRLAQGTDPTPCLLRLPSGLQPYPWPVGGPIEGAPTVVDSLLAGMEAVLAAADSGQAAPADRVDGLDRERRRLERKLAALRRQLEETGKATQLREDAGLILSSLREIQPGAKRVALVGFDGMPRLLELDPALRPHENADARFRLAARMERGAATLVRRIRDAEAALARIARAARLDDHGKLSPEELAALLPAAPTKGDRRDLAAPSLPYRRYRSSGGLEVRVGRGPRRNDDLTFHHSRPNDVWLHARHVGGAHVVLRWTRAERPPAADLEEAATLAANHSGARGSGLVPVDWTRRKWVRKPRGASPGVVSPDRVQTVFVSPDRSLDERLRHDGGVPARPK